MTVGSIKTGTAIAVLSLLLGFARFASAATPAPVPFVLKCYCQTVEEFTAAVMDDMLVRADSWDSRAGIYVVISEADSKIAVVNTWYSLWFVPYQGFSYIPEIDLLTETEEEMAYMDQYLLARAAYDKAHVGDLPTVTYPNSNVYVGAGSYQETVFIFMNSHPNIKLQQLGQEVAWNTFTASLNSFKAKLASMFGATIGYKPYVKIVFSDGSYGVFCIVDSTTAGVNPVYFVDKDGNVTMIDENLLDGVEDPNLPAPEVTGDVDDVPHGGGAGGGWWGAGLNNTPATMPNGWTLYAIFSGAGGQRVGHVYIEDINY